jgi:hypothetical protein
MIAVFNWQRQSFAFIFSDNRLASNDDFMILPAPPCHRRDDAAGFFLSRTRQNGASLTVPLRFAP